MEYLEAKDSVVIFSKRMGLKTIANKLAELNGEQVNGFFINRKIRVPRKLNVMALFGALNDRIKELNSRSLSKDAFKKLVFYPEFSEYQLQLLFEKIGTEDDFLKYRTYLWMLIIRNFDVLRLLDGEAQYLINVKKQKMDDFKSYSSCLNKCSMDLDNEFDGAPLMNLETMLKNSFSQDDIRKLAKKYDIIIPNRLKRDELVQYVKLIMKSRKRLTPELEHELDEMTVVQLNSFCSLHRMTLSAVLKKDELIYLFLFLLRQSEMDTLPIHELIRYPFADPLNFTVDLSVVDAFGRGEPKKVILLSEPEEIDDPVDEEEPEVIDEPVVEEAQEEVDEPVVEEEPEEVDEPVVEEEPEEVDEPVDEEEPEEVDEPVVEEEPEEVDEPVIEEEPEEVDEPVIEEEPEEVDEPVDEEEPEEVDEPVVEEEPEEVDEPVIEEEPEEVDEPVVEEELEEVDEPVVEEEPEVADEPVVEEEPEVADEPVDEEEPEQDEDDFDLDDLDDDDEFDDETLDAFNIDDYDDLDEEESKENVLEENKVLENESYDEEFNTPEPIEEVVGEGIESPYFRNKKLVSKKKNAIIVSVCTAVIVGVLLGLLVVLYLFG